MPSGKRKRVSSPTNGDMAPSPSAYSKESRLNSGLASDAADKVDVVYELVGTDKNITRSLSNDSLYTVLPEVVSALNIPPLGVSFFHLRNGAFESPVYDDFDWRSIRERALATDSKREVIRVYSAVYGQTPPPSPWSAPTSSVSSSSSATPRSALRTPGPAGTPRSEKRVTLALPIEQPASPSPNAQAGPSIRTAKRRHKKKKSIGGRDSEESGQSVSPEVTPPPTSASTPAASTSSLPPSPNAARKAIISKVSQFKPARPSPLGQAADESSDDQAPVPSNKQLTAKEKRERVKQQRKEKEAEEKREQKKLQQKEKKKRRRSSMSPAVAQETTTPPSVVDAPPAAVDSLPATASTPVANGSAVTSQSVAGEDSDPATSDPSPAVDATPSKGKGKENSGTTSAVSDAIAAALAARRASASSSNGSSQEPAPTTPAAVTPETTKKKAKQAKADPPETPTQRYMRLAKESLATESDGSGAKDAPSSTSNDTAAAPETDASPVQATPSSSKTTPATEKRARQSPIKETPTANGTANGTLEKTPPSAPESAPVPAEAPAADAMDVDEAAPSSSTEPSSPLNTAAALASDASVCALCGKEVSHEQKDCPTVAAGVGALKDRLKQRKVEVSVAAKKAGTLVRPAQQSDSQIMALNTWIERVTSVKHKVLNGSPNLNPSAADANATPIKTAPSKEKEVITISSQEGTTATVEDDGAATPAKEKEATILAQEKETPTSTDEEVAVSMTTTATQLPNGNVPATPNASQKATVASASSSDDTPKPPAMQPTAIEEPSGSDSNSDSDSSSEDETEAAPAVRVAIPGVGTPETPFYPQALHLKAAARPRRPGSMSGLSVSDAVIETVDSDSESSSSSSETEESVDSTDSDSDSESSAAADLDPEELMRQMMTKPLSQKQRKQARRSAAAMHSVAGEEEDVSDISSDENTPTRSQARRGSDSSIGDFDEPMMVDEAEPEVETESEGERERAALVIAVEDATSSTVSTRRSLSRIGMSSPLRQDLPGDIVMQEAISEDAALDMGSVESIGEDDLAATQIIQPTPKRLTRRAQAASQQAPASQPAQASQPVRRSLRSSSREPSASQPAPRTTRASSREPQSNSQPLPTRRTRASSREAASAPSGSQRTTRSQAQVESPPEVITEEEVEEAPPGQRAPSHSPAPSSVLAPSSSQAVSLAVSPSKLDSPSPRTQSSPIARPFSLTQEQLVSTQREQTEESQEGLFFSQATQKETQFYNPAPPPLVPETQVDGHSDSESEQGDDEDDDDDEDVGPAPVPALTFSQRAPSPLSFPTLGSLPKDLLRAGGNMATSLGNMFRPKKLEEVEGESESDSGSGSDSSEDEVPDARRERYAGGRRRTERRRTNGDMSSVGW